MQEPEWRLWGTTHQRPALWSCRGADSAKLTARQNLPIQVQRPIFPFGRTPRNGVAESRKWVRRSRVIIDSYLAPPVPVATRTRLIEEAPSPQTRVVQNYSRKTFAAMSQYGYNVSKQLLMEIALSIKVKYREDVFISFLVPSWYLNFVRLLFFGFFSDGGGSNSERRKQVTILRSRFASCRNA